MSFLLLDGFDAYKFGDFANNNWHGAPFDSPTGRFGDGYGISVIFANEIYQSMNPSIVGFAFTNTSIPRLYGTGGTVCYRLQGMTVCTDPSKYCGPHVIDFLVGIGVDEANRPFVFTTNWLHEPCPGHPDNCDFYYPGPTYFYGWGETPALHAEQWDYLEMNFDTLELRLNGETIVDSSSTATIHGTDFSTDGIDDDRLYFTAPGGIGASMRIDDLYVQDSGGSFLGDVHIKTLYPVGDGSHADWTPGPGGSGGTHFSRVDETRFDADRSFNYSSTAGAKDTYLMQALSATSGTIYATQLNLAVALEYSLTSATFKPLIRQGGVDYDGPTSVTLSPAAGYNLASYLSTIDPTSAPWTVTTVNGDEYGIDLVSVVP